MAIIEFYIGDAAKYLVSIEDGAVPRSGEFINIKNKTYEVVYVTWAVDHADNDLKKSLRANVELKKV